MFNTDGHRLSYDQMMDEIASLFIFFTANVEEMDPLSSSLGSYLMEYPDIEMSTRIISLAVKLRITDDRVSNLDLEESDQEQDEKPECKNICGCLDAKELSLREACNKIIHAKDIGLDDERQCLLVNGCLGKEEWKAQINLNKFLSHAFDYIQEVSDFDASYYHI